MSSREEHVLLRGSNCKMCIDRQRGELAFVRHSLIGKSSQTVFPLDKLEDLRLRVGKGPALTLASVGKILSMAFDASQSQTETDVDEAMDSIPRPLKLRIRFRTDHGIESFDESFAVEGLAEDTSVVDTAVELGTACGLTGVSLYRVPAWGVEIHLQRGDSSPESAIYVDALDKAPVPPFEPGDFDRKFCEYRLKQWSPGESVHFRKPLSKAAPFMMPLTLLVFTGPALYLYGYLAGFSPNPMFVLIAGVLGLVTGITMLLMLGNLLPRSAELDWGRRELRLRSWFKRQTLAFDDIERLELEAQTIEHSGGESGGSTTYYLAKLLAVPHKSQHDESDPVPIMETRHFKHMDDPLWITVPLLHELATALGVEGRFVDYPFRQELLKGSG